MAGRKRVLTPFLWLVLVLLIAAKIGLIVARGPSPIVLDAAEYWDLSSHVLDGDLLMRSEPIAYRTPLYPWFLAAVGAGSGTFRLPATVVVQGLLLLLAVLLAARLSWRITGSVAVALVTVAALVPPIAAITYTTTVLTETLFTTLLVANLLSVARYAQVRTTSTAALAALTFALALLTRPVVIGLWIPHLIFIVLIGRSRRESTGVCGDATFRGLLTHGLLAAGILALLIAPWLMRNRELFGRPFLTEFLGRNVWIVAFQGGSASEFPLPDSESGRELRRRLARSPDDVDWRHTWAVSEALSASGLDDAAGDRLMKRVAFEAIVENRVAFATQALRRMVNFWRCASTDLPQPPSAVIPDDRSIDQRTWSWRFRVLEAWIDHRWSRSIAGNTALTALIAMATLTMMIHSPTRWHGFWIAMVFIYFAFITGLIEIPAYRYRMVLEPLFAVAVAAGAYAGWALITAPAKRHRVFPERQ